MTNRSSILGVAVFLMALVAGVRTAYNSWNGYVYVYVEEGRSPSAIPKNHDLTRFAGAELTKRIHERLVGEAHVIRREGALGLELGQFVTEDGANRKVLACSVFKKVELTFVAEGIAESGAAPIMEVEGDCEVAMGNIKWMRPIWIPVGEIKSLPPTNKELSYFDDEPVTIRFTAMGSEWPSRWVLNSVRLFSDENAADEVVIDRAQIRSAAPKSIILEW